MFNDPTQKRTDFGYNLIKVFVEMTGFPLNPINFDYFVQNF